MNPYIIEHIIAEYGGGRLSSYPSSIGCQTNFMKHFINGYLNISLFLLVLIKIVKIKFD